MGTAVELSPVIGVIGVETNHDSESVSANRGDDLANHELFVV